MHRRATIESAGPTETAPLHEVAPPPSIELRPAADLLHMAWRQGGNHFPCYTGPTRDVQGGAVVQPESFTAMVIADLLLEQQEHRPLVRSVGAMLHRELTEGDLFHFFKEHERLPADADCTALGLSVMLRSGARVQHRAHHALDRILANTDANGVIETYFDPTGERDGIVDPVVCANVLFLAYQLGRGDEARPTLEHVHRVLVEGEFLDGTRYYHSPDSFLYFLGRVVRHFPETHDLLLEPLRAAVRDRQGSTDYIIDVAQRVLLSAWFGLDDGGELQRLADLQSGGGTWPADALFRYGRKVIYFGGRVLGTAFAMSAAHHGMAGGSMPGRRRSRRDIAMRETADRSDPRGVGDQAGEAIVADDNVAYVHFRR